MSIKGFAHLDSSTGKVPSGEVNALIPANNLSDLTDAASARASLGLNSLLYDVLFDHYADVNNSGTAETDLYSDTLIAGQLSNNGEKICAEYTGTFVGDATSTQRIKAYFGGAQIFDSGALNIGVLTYGWNLRILAIRESSSIVRCCASFSVGLGVGDAYTKITGLTLSNTQILKITGTASGVSGASNQITASAGYVEFKPIA